ncbi:MAG: hypothetical protein Q8K41_10030 [Hydrogenophaga sp.]|nr:hypothetical protein [Hydrogenophaga sp.]
MQPIDFDQWGFRGFMLLVDGQPIYEVPGVVFSEISYWEFAEEQAALKRDADQLDYHQLIGVCDCGFAGCGATWVRVVKEAGNVLFSEFSGLQKHEEPRTLTFTAENYNEVMARMDVLAESYRVLDAAARSAQS